MLTKAKCDNFLVLEIVSSCCWALERKSILAAS